MLLSRFCADIYSVVPQQGGTGPARRDRCRPQVRPTAWNHFDSGDRRRLRTCFFSRCLLSACCATATLHRAGTTHQRSVRSRAAIRSNHSWGERVRFSPCRARASASSRPAQRSKMWRTSRYIHAWRGGWAAALTVVLRAVDSTTSAWVATLTPWWCLLSPTLSVSVTLNCIAEREHTGTRPLSLFVYPPPLCPGPFDSTVLLI